MFTTLWRMSVLSGIFAAAAMANVTLPIGNFNCAFQMPPLFHSVVIQDCTSQGLASATPPPASGLQGVGLGYSGSVTWPVAGTDAGGSQATGGTTQTQVDILTMSSSGLTGGSGSANIYLPLDYDFTLSPLTSFSCLTTSPCTPPGLTWSLSMQLSGPAVSNSDGAFLNIANGSSTGHFTGSVVVPHSANPNVSSPAMTITAGEAVTVSATLTLVASNFPSDGSGSYSVLVPEGATFDFQSAENAQSTPEPATLSVFAMAGLLALAWRRRRTRGAASR